MFCIKSLNLFDCAGSIASNCSTLFVTNGRVYITVAFQVFLLKKKKKIPCLHRLNTYKERKQTNTFVVMAMHVKGSVWFGTSVRWDRIVAVWDQRVEPITGEKSVTENSKHTESWALTWDLILIKEVRVREMSQGVDSFSTTADSSSDGSAAANHRFTVH